MTVYSYVWGIFSSEDTSSVLHEGRTSNVMDNSFVGKVEKRACISELWRTKTIYQEGVFRTEDCYLGVQMSKVQITADLRLQQS